MEQNGESKNRPKEIYSMFLVGFFGTKYKYSKPLKRVKNKMETTQRVTPKYLYPHIFFFSFTKWNTQLLKKEIYEYWYGHWLTCIYIVVYIQLFKFTKVHILFGFP